MWNTCEQIVACSCRCGNDQSPTDPTCVSLPVPLYGFIFTRGEQSVGRQQRATSLKPWCGSRGGGGIVLLLFFEEWIEYKVRSSRSVYLNTCAIQRTSVCGYRTSASMFDDFGIPGIHYKKVVKFAIGFITIWLACNWKKWNVFFFWKSYVSVVGYTFKAQGEYQYEYGEEICFISCCSRTWTCVINWGLKANFATAQ